MKVLLVAYAFAEYSMRLANALARRHDVTLVVTSQGVAKEIGAAPAPPRLASGHEIQFPVRQFRDPRWPLDAWAIHRLAERLAVDVVHVQEAATDAVALTAWLTRRPMVLTVHDPMPHSGRDSRRGWRRLKYRDFVRSRARAVIVHGEALKTPARAAGISCEIFVAPHPPLGFGQGRSPLPDGQPTFLLFGRMEAYKGVEEFLAASRLVRREVPSARFVVAGVGPEIERLKPVMKSSEGVELIERFLAPEELAGVFRAASAVVLPYRDATQSGVAGLAMGFGRGMIATSVGALPEVCIPGRSGVLVAPGDVEGLARAMANWAQDLPTAERLGAGAFDLGLCEASWDEAAKVAERAYQFARD